MSGEEKKLYKAFISIKVPKHPYDYHHSYPKNLLIYIRASSSHTPEEVGYELKQKWKKLKEVIRKRLGKKLGPFRIEGSIGFRGDLAEKGGIIDETYIFDLESLNGAKEANESLEPFLYQAR